MSPQPFSADRPLPEGVRDLLFADAAAWRELEAALRRTWSTWGYREIILPTFEYADTLATDVGAEIDAELYRFFDRHGRTLALRADMTIPTARVVGTRLYDQPMPMRIAYVGSVFRYEPPRAGRQHEFTQAGVELFGAKGSAADAESIALAVAALRAAELPEFRITVGHVGFFRGLLAAMSLPDKLRARVRDAVDRKAEAELAGLLSEADAAPKAASEALRRISRLTGDVTVLAEAKALCLHPLMEAALADLENVASLLSAYGVSDTVHYDLAEVRDLDYYTGITFEGFAPGMGFNLISGGRYDELVGHFGPPFPAVGWALTLDRVLLAREIQGLPHREPSPDAILCRPDGAIGFQWASQARARGLAVEIDPQGLTFEEVWRAALARGVPRVVRLESPGVISVRDAQGERQIPADDWEEVTAWLSHR